ncbi:MAG: V-type ATP synthase subunit I, partial [Bacteroidales bacterium]
MVVEMKKVSFLIYHKEYMDVLNAIRELGVLHVIEKEKGAINDPDLEDLILEANKAKEAIKVLTHYRDKDAAEKSKVKLNFDLPTSLAKLDELSDKRDKLNQQKQLFLKEYDQLSTWGNFKPESLDRLREIGYHVDFFTCSAKNFSDQWVEDYNATIITNVGSTYYFITISKDIVEIDAERVKLPNISLEEVLKEVEGVDTELQQIEDSLKVIANNELPSFEKALRKLTGEIEFSKVLMDTKSMADQKVMLLEGWVPADKTQALEDYFKDQSIYFEITDKQEGDEPPVLLKNSRFARLFEPITKIFSLPGYDELDLTPYLAPFFILFFGFCTGDAGYGLLIVLFCTFAKKKLAAYKDYLSLGQWLGAGAILFGILSGTFFGIELAKVPALARFREYFLSMDNLMALSIVLGGIQVIFGMALHAANQAKQKGFKYAISRIGWIMILL